MDKKIFIVSEGIAELRLIQEIIKQLDKKLKVKGTISLPKLANLTISKSTYKPDLLLFYIQLPTLKLVELLKKLQGNDRFRNVPKFLLGADGPAQPVETFLSEGIDDFYVLPEQPSSLKVLLKRILMNVSPDPSLTAMSY